MSEKYLIKRRNNAKNRIEHLETASTAPTPAEVFKRWGNGKYVIFAVKKGVKGIKKVAAFGIDKAGKIIEKSEETVKKVTPSVKYRTVLLKSEIVTKPGGLKVRKDYVKKVPITTVGVVSEAKKRETEVKKLEEEKLEKELQKTIVPVDPEERESKEALPYIIPTLLGIAATFLSIFIYQEVKK